MAKVMRLLAEFRFRLAALERQAPCGDPQQSGDHAQQ